MLPYPFQSGDQGKYFLIMDNGEPPPFDIGVCRHWAWPAAKSQALMADNGAPDDMLPYPLQSGDQGKEFLIMDNGGPPPPEISVLRHSAWPAAESQALMAALDQAVVDSMPTDKAGYTARLQKELAALKDVETKLQAAQSNRAPDDEIADLSNQLRGHEENAASPQSMLQQHALPTPNFTSRP